MKQLSLIFLLISTGCCALAQEDIIVFKKKDHPLAYYRKDSYIVFQLNSKEWYTGFINKIQHDSFFVNPMIVHYFFGGTDTVRYNELKVSLADVYAMPRPGELVNYKNERAYPIPGHEHWVWLKNGLIFRAGGAGYILLNLINGLLKKPVSYSLPPLLIAGGVVVVGEILHQTYQPHLRLGKKYRLASIKVGD